MSMQSGSISFAKFNVVGQHPAAITVDLLEKFAAHILKPTEVGMPEDVEWGWCGTHMFDTEISFEKNVYNDCIILNMRVDTNKVPANVLKSQRQIFEDALAKNNPSGFISKVQKREAKDDTGRWADTQLRERKYTKSSMIEIVWDFNKRAVYTSAKGASLEKLQELFSRTTELELQQTNAGYQGLLYAERLGQRRVYEDIMPTRFAKSLEDPDMPAEYPWTAKGDGAKTFLGNEFLLWLFYESKKSGVIHPTETGPYNTVTVMIDRSINLACVYGQSGTEAMRAVGPTRSPEMFAALRNCKVPRSAGMILDIPIGQFFFTLDPERMALSGTKLPEIEKADTQRTLTEERISMVRDLIECLELMYQHFLLLRTTPELWNEIVNSIRTWIFNGNATQKQA